VLQWSGSASDTVLDPLRSRGFPAGTFHPLVPLADPAGAAALFRDAWVGVGGDARAVGAAERFARLLGAHTLPIPRDREARARYHAAAVVASNFPVALVALAERLCVAAGVDGFAARAATWHLLQSAVTNLHGSSPRDALTGPVARGDETTIDRHLAALAGDADAHDAYVALTRVLRAERAPAAAAVR
jgi:predicted short-subunit dehydrogenase-like oxidoreductase (DUF2520 family)